MTVLTPGCDPDMSTTGAPFGPTTARGPRLRSGVVLSVAVLLAVLVVGTDAPGAVSAPVAVVGVLCALALLGRGVRLARRAGAAAAVSLARAGHAPEPVASPMP